MNILMQVCGILVILFLIILYKSHKTLNLPSERVFTRFMVISLICLTLDALSIVAIHYRASIPEWLWKTSCKTYLMSLIWVGWINFSYVSIDLNSTPSNHRRSELILAGVTVAESILVAFLPIDVFEEGMEVYSFGPAVIATYICTIIYIVSTLNVSLYIMRHGSKRRGFAVIITTSLWILAALIQFIRNEILVVGFSEAIGTMILYIVMENPDGNIDKRFGCFNPNAFHEYIKVRFNMPEDFSLIDFSLTDIKALEEKGINVEAAAKDLIDKISSYDGLLLFKNDFSNLVVISEDDELLNRVADDMLAIGSNYNSNGNEIGIFVLNHARQFNTSADLLNFLNYIRGNNVSRLSTIVHVSDEMINGYRNIGIIKKEIDDALREDRVEVFMQPIYSNTEKKIVSAEALVRIRKPEGGYLSPGAFIPVAESSGQVKALGERVLEKVCQFIKNTNAIQLGLKHIDVNLSAVQCDDNTMAGKICKIVEGYGVDSALISFEITETAVSHAKDTLIENMEALISKGFNFALDDFGKGESNLIYIVEMPVKFIKLDIEMSKAYFANPKAKHVVASISEMANRLGLPIVAEGIETEDEVEGISTEGIEFIQGYYYSRPLPMNDFIKYLENFREQSIRSEGTEKTEEHKCEEEEMPFNFEDFEGQKVLLVEDNELNREIAAELLEEFGFVVDTAEDGTFAVEKMQKASAGDYDFVLMDIRMPYMDGLEATRRIRSLPNKTVADIPVIALTAYADDENKKIASSVGIDAFAAKPIDIKKIMGLLTTIKTKKKLKENK